MRRSSRSVTDALSRVPLFERCSRRELSRVASLMTPLEMAEGSVLTRQGDPGNQCFVIIEGTVDVRIDDRTVAELGAGEVVGEMALLDGRPRTATVRARTPLRLEVLDRREFMSLLENTPSVTLKLLKTLAERIRGFEPARPH